MPLVWTVETSAPEADLLVISSGVFSHGRTLAHDGNAQPVSCIVRDVGTVVAGGSGRTEYGRLFVNYLWVAEHLRGQGIARRVLSELERAAADRGCTDSLIETLDDSTAQLYSKLGYEPLAVLEKYVGRFNRHTLLKSGLRSLGDV